MFLWNAIPIIPLSSMVCSLAAHRAATSYAVLTVNVEYNFTVFTKHKSDRRELYFVFTCYITRNNTKMQQKR